MAIIRFTNRLDRHVACPQESVDGSTVIEVLRTYFSNHTRLAGYVLDERERLRTRMTIFIDGQPIRDRNNLHQPISGDATIDVIQALSGG